MGNRTADVKQYRNYENKWKREPKDLKNRTRYYLAWKSTQVHVINLRRSRRSAPGHPINMITLAAIDLALILIPPSLVTASETK